MSERIDPERLQAWLDNGTGEGRQMAEELSAFRAEREHVAKMGAFIREMAARNPVFAKGIDKDRIANARAILAAFDEEADGPAKG